MSRHRNALFLLLAVLALVPGEACAQESDGAAPASTGLFRRLFAKRPGQGETAPEEAPPKLRELVHDPSMDPETDTVSVLFDGFSEEWSGRENDPMERYPSTPGYETLAKASQKDIEALIGRIYESYEARVSRMDPPDLRSSRSLAMGMVPVGFATVWKDSVRDVLWDPSSRAPRDLEALYRSALEHSNHLKVYRDLPLIRETGIQEADGEFDIETFIDGRLTRTNDPVSTLLDTGNAETRFLENRDVIEAGLRKKLSSGAQLALSNRLQTLSNNSRFLVPQNQGSSQFVLSVAQPLLEGAGYHYNQSRIKLAKFESRTASAEFVRHLESHLLEINRAYWTLYYSRAYFLLIRQLVLDTSEILGQLEQRSDLDALQSEVLRARAALAMRKAMLNRAEMDIRNNEERLRALINDPGEDIGSNLELIPATAPVLERYYDDLRLVSRDALHNRAEILQGFDALRAAIVRRDMQKNEKLPTLNLVAELMLGDIEGNDRAGGAFQNQFGDGTGYMMGFQFSQPWDNDSARARLLRSEIELRQQASRLRAIIDLVLVESLVSYRELMAAYRDMQGRYATLKASREELRQLRDRLEVDTDQAGGRTTAAQLQFILDSMDRNQSAEELFLGSVVSYNIAFAAMQRARGTFLRTENVRIERVLDTDPTHPKQELERLQLRKSDDAKSEAPGAPSPPPSNARRGGLTAMPVFESAEPAGAESGAPEKKAPRPVNWRFGKKEPTTATVVAEPTETLPPPEP